MAKINIQINLYHPNIISISEVIFPNSSEITFVTEFHGESLRKKIDKAIKENYNIPESLIFFWMIQICAGLKTIYDNNIVLRDFNPTNIFVTSDNIVKISNFSFAKIIENKLGLVFTRIGVPVYCAPEVFEGEGYDRSADLYSLGVIFYELCSLKLQYPSAFSHTQQVKLINESKKDPLPDIYSNELRDIIDKMLEKDRSSRITLENILCNPFIKTFLKSYLCNKRLRCDYGHDLIFTKTLKNSSEKFQCSKCNNSGLIIDGVYTCPKCIKKPYYCCPFENKVENMYLLKTQKYEKCFIDPEELIPSFGLFPKNIESPYLKQAYEYLAYKEHFIKKKFKMILNLMIIESKNQELKEFNMNNEIILKKASEEECWNQFQNDLNEQIELINIYFSIKQSEFLKTYFYNLLVIIITILALYQQMSNKRILM